MIMLQNEEDARNSRVEKRVLCERTYEKEFKERMCIIEYNLTARRCNDEGDMSLVRNIQRENVPISASNCMATVPA